MADATTTFRPAGRAQPTLALAALLLLSSIAGPARSSEADDRGGDSAFSGVSVSAPDSALALVRLVRVAPSDSTPRPDAVADSAHTSGGAPLLLAATPSAADAAASWGVTAPGGFTIRRIANPRYRPPIKGEALLSPGSTGVMQALDHAHVQLVSRGAGPSLTRVWDLAAGREYRRGRAFEFTTSGTTHDQGSDLRTLRLDAREAGWFGSLGDVQPVIVGAVASLQRLRGASLKLELPGGGIAQAMGGGPTPVPGQSARAIRLGGALLDEVRFDQATLSAGFVGFGRGAAPRRGLAVADPDSLAGAGGVATFGMHAPLAAGVLGISVAGGFHDLDGKRGLTAQQAFDWSLINPVATLVLHDERATRRARIIGTETFLAAPRSEDRWNAQLRAWKGRVETHFTGVLREGGDTSLTARSVQVGGSGNLGASPWYAGADYTWDRRGVPVVAERRTSFSIGNVSSSGFAVLFRGERTRIVGGRDALQLANETSVALPRGGRLELSPKAGWDERKFSQALLTTRVTWLLPWLSSRVSGGVSLGAQRDGGFRTGVQEAEIGISFAPRPRDLGNIEARRLDQGGPAQYEYTTAYDLQASRYENASGFFSRRDSSRVIVRVMRAGNRTGVEEVLVSLDGKELRFTNADGIAHFDHVTPGVHIVALEERSLPVSYKVTSSTRVFVTVERGRVPDPVSFEIARPARKQVFGGND
jgi:hypothetical protein